ncbi:MAG: phosphate propanoyltransferase [Oscillospiraceae bacterium]|nr:phosphate propanoyltransferase [Oscillospiraceae bacterium]
MSKPITIETSARHIHLSADALAALFGEGFELTVRKSLSQPGEYASDQRVDLVGPKKTLAGVSILGPVRPVTQVEISMTDARSLGIDAPVRESGDVSGTPGCKLVGPAGEITLDEGVIVAKRHIHMTEADAAGFGVVNRQTVAVRTRSGGRSLVFGDVVARVSDSYLLAMHIDTDESCACGGADAGELKIEN